MASVTWKRDRIKTWLSGSTVDATMERCKVSEASTLLFIIGLVVMVIVLVPMWD